MDVLTRAARVGHDIDRVKNGEVVRSEVTIDCIQAFKEIFGGTVGDAQRALFSQELAALPDVRYGGQSIPQLTRLIDYVYGNAELSADDEKYANQLFPIIVIAVSGTVVTIDKDETIGPAAQPYYINADTLVFAGGSLSVITTSLTVVAENLQIGSACNQATFGSKPYHIGIFGAAGPQPPPAPAGKPYAAPAQAGSNASAPSPGICTGAGSGGNGHDGATGVAGDPGQAGVDGDPNLPAVITIRAYDGPSPFVIATQSGPGGTGGMGGAGGPGQEGGRGGHGCSSGGEGTDGGNGGKGGAGHDGASGGVGGNGVAGNPLTVTFPQSQKSKLVTIPQAAPPGKGGEGGDGGAGGAGGAGGSGGHHSSNGSAGGGGAPGTKGATGPAGQSSGPPGPFNFNWI